MAVIPPERPRRPKREPERRPKGAGERPKRLRGEQEAAASVSVAGSSALKLAGTQPVLSRNASGDGRRRPGKNAATAPLVSIHVMEHMIHFI